MAKKQIQTKTSNKINQEISIEKPKNNNFLYGKFNNNRINLIIIIAFSALIYFQVLGFVFSGLDDFFIVANSKQLGGVKNLSEYLIRDAFIGDRGAEFYRPVQNITIMIDTMISGDNPWAYHLSNLIYFILTVSVLYFFLLNLELNRKISLILTLIFSVNPLFCQVVAWIPARGDILMTLFGLLSFIYFIRYTKTKSIISLLLNVLFLILSIYSKETSIAFPLFFILYIYFNRNKTEQVLKLKDYFLPIVLWVVADGSYLYARSLFVKIKITQESFSFNNFLNNLQTIPELFGKFFLPFNLAPMAGFSMFNTILGFSIILIVIYLISKAKNADNFFVFMGLIWFFAYLLPGMFYRHGFGSSSYDYLEHRAFLPSIGLIIFIAGLLKNKKNFLNNGPILITAFLVIMVFSCYNVIYANNFKNELSFFNLATSRNPKSALAVNSLGVETRKKGDIDGAINYYKKAVEIKPDYSDAYYNIATNYNDLKDYSSAIIYINKAMEYDKDKDKDYYYIFRASMKFNLKDYAGALPDYDTYLKTDPNNSDALNKKGIILAQSGDYKDALPYFEKASSLSPNDEKILTNKANAHHALGDVDVACQDWQRAAQMGSEMAKMMIQRYCK